LYLVAHAGLGAGAAWANMPGAASAVGTRVQSEVGAPHASPPADPDVLYEAREDLTHALGAAEIWTARLDADPRDFESAWKLARVRYWLGTNGLPDEGARKKVLEEGIAAGRAAVAIHPHRPEGHFWMAANMGALAESFGIRQGLRYRGAIKDALERVLAVGPDYLDGSADRALGRWYYKVPRLFGGSGSQSESHLRKALAYNPDSVISRLFLAETLIERDKHAEAREHLAAAIDAPPDPQWIPEDRRFRARARTLLERLQRPPRHP